MLIYANFYDFHFRILKKDLFEVVLFFFFFFLEIKNKYK